MVALREQLLNEFDKLPPEKQQQVLQFTHSLTNNLPIGTPTETLLAHMGSFHFEPGELETMAKAIEEDCEKVNLDDWQ